MQGRKRRLQHYQHSNHVSKTADPNTELPAPNSYLSDVRLEYEQEAARQLSNTSFYKPLPYDPTESYQKQLQHLLKKLPEKAQDQIRTDTPLEPRPGIFCLLPKIHKPGNPGRPIISGIGTLTAGLSGYVDSLLRLYATSTPSYLRDTTDFLRKLQSIGDLPDNTILATMDVEALYTNIPHKDGLQAVKNTIPDNVTTNLISGTAMARCAELQIQFTEAVSTVADQKELITNLERDLSTIQSMSSMHRPDAEGAAVHSLETIPDPIKEATALFYGYPQSSPSTPLPEGQMDSLLSIISSQRERFRTRNQELEAENRMMQHTMQALQSELDNMRADNIKLYEKIKFLQSYPGRGGSSDDTELRYSTQYEERLDPFSSFSRKERQRKYLSLSPWDKATLSMGRLILSSKAARTVAFFYTLLLHCLVFLVLYKTAWSESVGRDCTAYCAKKYADHLHKFHENGDNGDMWQ
ncbi:unnamed protein product [Caretta caretta]